MARMLMLVAIRCFYCAADGSTTFKPVTDLSVVLPLQEEQDFLIIRDQDAEGQVTLSAAAGNTVNLGTAGGNAE